jgi:hypothetical protein
VIVSHDVMKRDRKCGEDLGRSQPHTSMQHIFNIASTDMLTNKNLSILHHRNNFAMNGFGASLDIYHISNSARLVL